MDLSVLEIGKHYNLTKKDFENHLIQIFLRMGRISKNAVKEHDPSCQHIDKTYGGQPRCSLTEEKEACYFLRSNERCPIHDTNLLLTLYYVHLDEDVAKEVMDPEDFDLLKDDGDFEMHIATWESGVGWIVDYTGMRKLLIRIAHTYEHPQLCINCDVYKEQVEKVGKDHWAVNKTCQDCICGNNGWPNFTMVIQEE